MLNTAVRVRFFYFVSVLLFIALSVCGLYIDVINPDGINWHTRSYTFFSSLLTKSFSSTYQAYHPGTTLMWISGPVVYGVGQYYLTNEQELYSKSTFLTYDYAAKLSVIVISSLIFLLSLKLLHSLINDKSLVLFSMLIICEPFLIGERRLYHLDYLMSYLLFVSFLFFYTYFFVNNKNQNLIFGVLFFVLSFLTKTTTLLFLPIPYLMAFVSNACLKTKVLTIVKMLLLTAVCVLAFFPPFWKRPLKSIPKYTKQIISGITSVGISGQKEYGYSGEKAALILADKIEEFDWYYYLLALKYQLSPVLQLIIVISILLFIYNIFVLTSKFIFRKKITLPKNWLLALFCLLILSIFITALSMATKKNERYAIVYIPYIMLLTSYVIGTLTTKKIYLLLGLYLISLPIQYKQIYPYFFLELLLHR